LVVWEKPCGLVDESFGAAFALRAVWTARGQHPCCPPPAHTLRPLAHRVHKDNNRVKVSGTGKYILVSGGFYYNLQLTKMVHAEYLPTNSAEEPKSCTREEDLTYTFRCGRNLSGERF